MSLFQASGVITLTTDFGNRGPYLAVMKGMILKGFPEARMIDLTHDTFVHWTAEAAFWLERSFRFFPSGTVHLAVVDPGGGDVIAVVREGHVFLGPDNGLLAAVVDQFRGTDVYLVESARVGTVGVSGLSQNFRGRDFFAPLAAELAAGRVRPDKLGPKLREIVPSAVPEAEVDSKQAIGTVISTDPFGNLITNIGKRLVERFEHPEVTAGGRSFPVNVSYADVAPGEFTALINSFGTLEIARAQQSAADSLSLGRGAPVTVKERAPSR